ncbi:MAG: tetratricopeptide repeat protein [Bacteroidota bacterium]
MNKIVFVLICTLLCGSTAIGQKFNSEPDPSLYGTSLKQILKAADEAMEVNKDYYTAMRWYKRAREVKPKNVEFAYKYAEAARQARSFARAEEGYQDVLKLREDKGQYPLTHFWLANMRQLLGKYEKAITMYERFAEEHTGNENVPTYFIQRAKKEKQDCIWAKDIAEEQHNVDVQHIGEEINTPNKEFGAFIIGDTLFYSSLSFESRKDNEPTERSYSRIMYSVNGEQGVELMDEVNDTTRHTANLAYSEDLTKKVFTRCNYLSPESVEIRCKIYYQFKLSDGSWSDPEPLPDDIQQEGFTYTHPTIGRDFDEEKEYLYYVTDQDGGLGKLDIWKVELNTDGTFGTPENVSIINTEENDITPFYHNATQTLFYSTEGMLGMGGFDVHKIIKEDGEWTDPKNLGKPINSSLNDISFTLNEEGDKGFFASNREGSLYLDKEFELCCDDLYSAEFDIKAELLVATFDGASLDQLPGTTVRLLEIQRDGSKEEIAKLTNPETNEFVFFVERGKKYEIEASKKGYVQQVEELAVSQDAPDQLAQNIYLNPIIVDLKALTYDLDTELPITGVTVQVIEQLPDGSERIVQEQVNEYGNDFIFPLESEKIYVIRATKPGYKPLEELELTTQDLLQPETFLAELYMKRTSFVDYLPLAIYFDNDYPDVNSNSSKTRTNYAETIEDYYARKEEYKLLFAEPQEEEESFLTAQRYEQFFEREVKKGYEDLIAFAEVLTPFLERGNEVRLQLKGFASPRAEDGYNMNLSSRRVHSVENFFRSYNNGELLEYINIGLLIFDREAFGERQAPNFVISLLDDERNSIYSLGASLERRVEILEIEVRLNEEDAESPDLRSFSSKGGKE